LYLFINVEKITFIYCASATVRLVMSSSCTVVSGVRRTSQYFLGLLLFKIHWILN